MKGSITVRGAEISRKVPGRAMVRTAVLDASPTSKPPFARSWNRIGPQLAKILPLGLLTLALVAVPVLVFQPEGLGRMRSLTTELSSVNAENAELRREIGRLRVEVKRLKDDPAAVERIARDQLGLVRRSEVVFQFGARKDER